MATTTWYGRSGRSYEYELLTIGSKLPSRAGNYVFCKGEGSNRAPVYVGESSDLDARVSNHNEKECIERNGATHISYRLNAGGVDARRAEEKDIRERYNPACNG